ncbi:MAG: hypothetical protein J1E02_07580 [Coprobacter sp.]|nr:hypothetical protein [Coprobacter sp.]
MKQENTDIQMRLAAVTEVKFMMLPDKVSDNTDINDIQLGFANHSIEPDVDNDTIDLLFGVGFVYKEEVVLETVYRFSFSVKNLAQFITFNENNSISISHLMPYFLSVAVGTIRGILVVKTAGSVFSKMLLPMIDPYQLSDQLSAKNK